MRFMNQHMKVDPESENRLISRVEQYFVWLYCDEKPCVENSFKTPTGKLNGWIQVDLIKGVELPLGRYENSS